MRSGESGGLRAATVDEREFRGDGRLAALHVRGGRFVELPQAVGRVVELRDDVAEPRRRQIREIVLELRERAPDVIRLARFRDDVTRRVALEEAVDAPGAVVRDDFERRDALRPEELRDAQDIALQELAVLEDRGVDALQDVTRARRGLDLVRLVDVSGSVAVHVRHVADPRRLELRPLFVRHVRPLT